MQTCLGNDYSCILYKIGSILNHNDLLKMKTIGYEIDFPESLDIDTSKDLELARILFEKYGY